MSLELDNSKAPRVYTHLPHFPVGIRIINKDEEDEFDLGPLKKLKGTWRGNPSMGWNVISVPGLPPDGFVLEVIPYEEELSFTPVVTAGNRGAFVGTNENNQSIVGLLYQQVIKSVCVTSRCNDRGFPSGQIIHAERGLFLNLTNFNDDFPVARLSTIPHGNALLALGKAIDSANPGNNFFGSASTLPTTIAGAPIPGYGVDQFNNQQFPNEFNQLDPNTFLKISLGTQVIKDMTTLILSTKNLSGGILNIPFINSNAKATTLNAIFWIETIQGVGGHPDFLQLQYTQTIDLVFPPTGNPDPVVWPHVTINTLQKVNED
jgi:hypothetical protein